MIKVFYFILFLKTRRNKKQDIIKIKCEKVEKYLTNKDLFIIISCIIFLKKANCINMLTYYIPIIGKESVNNGST